MKMVIDMIYSDLDKNINKIKQDYNNSIDLNYKELTLNDKKLTLVYNYTLCNNRFINDFILKNISDLEKREIPLNNIIDT